MDDYDLSEDQDSTNSEEMDSLLLQAYTNTVPVNMISANSSYSTESGEIKEMPLPQPPPPPPEQITLNLITIDDSDDSDDDKKGKRGPKRYYDKIDLSVQCFRCKQYGHTQFECVEDTNKNIRCNECGELGHIKANCPNQVISSPTTSKLIRLTREKVCYNCLEKGHQSKDCPKERLPTCHRCGEKGHVANQCGSHYSHHRIPIIHKIGLGSGKRYCFNCGSKGHVAYDCGEPTMAEMIRGLDGYHKSRRRSNY